MIPAFGDILFFLYGTDATARCESIIAPSNNAWHHIAVVFNHSTNTGDIKIYLNGSAQSTTLVQNDKNASGNLSAQTLFLGARNLSTTKFVGRIDDVCIFGRELDAAEVAALFAAGPL
jgi:hypothetical protein